MCLCTYIADFLYVVPLLLFMRNGSKIGHQTTGVSFLDSNKD